MKEISNFENLEALIASYPICQYGFLDTSELVFSEHVRQICQQECECYGTTWSCPPAVGSVDDCHRKCLNYKKALLFTTLAEVSDTAILEETLATRKEHEKVTRALLGDIQNSLGEECMALSSESCHICEHCTYPDSPCRHPERMFPCIESYGILVTESAEKCQIDFFYDSTTVTWFGMIFFGRYK